jgi:hypothetical protein
MRLDINDRSLRFFNSRHPLPKAKEGKEQAKCRDLWGRGLVIWRRDPGEDLGGVGDFGLGA